MNTYNRNMNDNQFEGKTTKIKYWINYKKLCCTRKTRGTEY